MKERIVGYLQGNLQHHLDHLAPLCSLMGWPLIVTEEEVFQLATLYYPDLQLHLWSVIEAPFEATKQFDTVITTLPRPFFDDIFLIAELCLNKRLNSVWLPHGNSDKGGLEALVSEERVFVYGPKMESALMPKNRKRSYPKICRIGNFRLAYFQKHFHFYEKILNQMNLEASFILYTPTWQGDKNLSSLEGALDEVISNLPSHSLVIKPHPNEAKTGAAERRKACYSLLPHVRWLDDFPPIYPLLQRASHLLGDFSSVGYDFLSFNRPMFFFNHSTLPKPSDPGRFLHQYGCVTTPNQLPALIKSSAQDGLSMNKQKLYNDTFGEDVPWSLTFKRVINWFK